MTQVFLAQDESFSSDFIRHAILRLRQKWGSSALRAFPMIGASEPRLAAFGENTGIASFAPSLQR